MDQSQAIEPSQALEPSQFSQTMEHSKAWEPSQLEQSQAIEMELNMLSVQRCGSAVVSHLSIKTSSVMIRN